MEQTLKTVGVIAEYNPFHNGHRYQIEEIRRRTDAENIIVIMGGNFLQRGMPAFTDKYLRTQMALSCGADYVFELPTVFATASAEQFACGGVSMLHQMGCVDGICFGSECGDMAPLSTIADFLSEEPEDFSEKLRQLVSQGISYPSARNQVLEEYFPEIFDAYPDLLTAPNNILAIEYLKALRKSNSPIIPVTIPRSDHGYHAEREREQYLSASAIRHRMLENTAFSPFIPEEVNRLLLEHPQRFPVTCDDFSEYLFYAIQTLEETEALKLSDMSQDLWNRIVREFRSYTDFTSFADKLKSKQYTHSRICRTLCHILLRIERELLDSPALYGRILGLDMSKSPLLREIIDFPLINKLADAEKILENFAVEHFSTEGEQTAYLLQAKKHLKIDIEAAHLYRRALFHKNGTLLPEEHQAGVIIFEQ